MKYIHLKTLRLYYATDICDSYDHSTGSYPAADKLVELARVRGFDGWFINIESKLPSAKDAMRMRDWLQYLCRKMHEAVPGYGCDIGVENLTL